MTRAISVATEDVRPGDYLDEGIMVVDVAWHADYPGCVMILTDRDGSTPTLFDRWARVTVLPAHPADTYELTRFDAYGNVTDADPDPGIHPPAWMLQ